jgi:hypothetical protein
MVARAKGRGVMNAPARITLAGLTALSLTGAHAVYRGWPARLGVEIYVPVSMYPAGEGDSGAARSIGIDIPAERLRFDVPRADNEPQAELFQSVRLAGALPVSGGEGEGRVPRLRGRDLFVQVEPNEPLWPDGPMSVRPVSVSDARIAGATNLAGHVTRQDERGRIWLTFGSHELTVPAAIAARAKPLDVRRAPNRPPAAMGREPDPGTFAIFRVLPSGRAALTGLVVDGKRIE